MRALLAAADWSDIRAPLLALWADTVQAHAAFRGADGVPRLVSVAVEGGGYPALSPHHPAAAGFERMVRDLWGHVALGGTDARGWLNHGRWELTRPLSPRPGAATGPGEPQFLPVGGEGLSQLAIGPVQGGIGEPVHLRVHAAGETVVRLEPRLGYAHKGTLLLMRGKSPRAAARFAARLAGDATVAHAIAFARAAEMALGIAPPPRALALRGVMAELERIAVHLGELGAVLRLAGIGAGRFGLHREAMLRAASSAFGHRLMMDAAVPGGVAIDLAADGAAAIRAATDAMLAELPALQRQCDTTPGLAGRMVGTGRVPAGLAAACAAGGPAARASGCAVDARRWPGYPPYDGLAFEVPLLDRGDVDARLRIRLAELRQSAVLLQHLLGDLPAGALTVSLPTLSGEGLGVAEGAQGDVWHWLRLDGGMIASAFAADPAWRLWPLVEQATLDGGVADIPLVLRSFAAGVSGMDL